MKFHIYGFSYIICQQFQALPGIMTALQFYKCLADTTRLKILLLMTSHPELCVCELTQALDEIQPKVSRHLAQLKQYGLITDRRQGQWIFYRLDDALPDWCRSVLQLTYENSAMLITPAELTLQDMQSRPERCG